MRTLAAFILTLAAILIPMAATAQISTDVTFNLPMPSGDFSDSFKPGFGAGADVFVGLPLMQIKLGGHVAYNRFAADDSFDDGHSNIIEILPSARYSIGLPLSPISFFGQLGVGMYNWSNEIETGGFKSKADGTDFGFAVGVGMTASIPGFGFIVMPMYHTVLADDTMNYLSFNVGLTF